MAGRAAAPQHRARIDLPRPRWLTSASGFFFERAPRLFLVTSRHVVIDEPSNHVPDRLEIELHVDASNLASAGGFSMPLYRDGTSVWREGTDSAGTVDVAVVELHRPALPATLLYRPFSPEHLYDSEPPKPENPSWSPGFRSDFTTISTTCRSCGRP